MSSKLHQVRVPLIEMKECENRFKKEGHKITIDKTKICAGWPEGGKDACQVTRNAFLENQFNILIHYID